MVEFFVLDIVWVIWIVFDFFFMVGDVGDSKFFLGFFSFGDFLVSIDLFFVNYCFVMIFIIVKVVYFFIRYFGSFDELW